MSKQGVRVAVVLVFFRMLAYASAERLLSVASLSLQESDVGDDDVRIFPTIKEPAPGKRCTDDSLMTITFFNLILLVDG